MSENHWIKDWLSVVLTDWLFVWQQFSRDLTKTLSSSKLNSKFEFNFCSSAARVQINNIFSYNNLASCKLYNKNKHTRVERLKLWPVAASLHYNVSKLSPSHNWVFANGQTVLIFWRFLCNGQLKLHIKNDFNVAMLLVFNSWVGKGAHTVANMAKMSAFILALKCRHLCCAPICPKSKCLLIL